MATTNSLSAQAEVVSIFLQGTLYGAFVVIFILANRTLVLRRSPERRLNKAMLGLSVTMFILATIHLVVNLIQILQIFGGQGDRPKSYQWDRLSDPTHFACTTIYFVQTLLGHGVALRAFWNVCGGRPTPIALLCLFFFGSAATGIGQLASISKYQNASRLTQQIWLITFFSFTLVFSITCTLMIATRAWILKKDKILSNTAGWMLYPTIIIQIVLESGAIYSGALVALIITLALKSWFQYVIFDSMTTIIGLVFSIIIHRMGLAITTDGRRFSTDNIFSNDVGSFKMDDALPRRPRNSTALSPSHFWPVQPDRSLPYHMPRPLQGRQQRRGTKTNILGFGKHGRRPRIDGEQCHYSLRSKMAHPSSYFRASEEISMDMELEVEMDEARLQKPKALPTAYMLP